jgi:maltose alpha-D-glucosyltransferase/alpha-amylase
VDYLRHWADLWYTHVSGAFLRSYLDSVQDSNVVPHDPKDFTMLLETFLVEKAVYELGYELNNRPDWLAIPMHGIQQLLKGGL